MSLPDYKGISPIMSFHKMTSETRIPKAEHSLSIDVLSVTQVNEY